MVLQSLCLGSLVTDELRVRQDRINKNKQSAVKNIEDFLGREISDTALNARAFSADRGTMKWWMLLFFIPQTLSAEYRVFELKIINEKTQKERTVYSTLDWLQYPEYHHLSRDERIELVDHWMCWKRSYGMFKPLCKRPVTADTLKAEIEGP